MKIHPTLLQRAAILLAISLLGGCASVSSTDSGAIGLDRKQYFSDGVRERVLTDAAKGYNENLTKALSHRAVNADPKSTQRVVSITNRLIPHAKAFRAEAVDWQWEVNVLSVDQVNAYCMAGGKIMIYTGLLDAVQSDDELAAVIGHEIAHALRDHTAEKISTRSRNNSVASGLGSVLSIGLALTTGINLHKTAQDVSQIGAHAMANLPNSRELEHEADRMGLELMARAGYNPMAAAAFWRRSIEASAKEGQANKSAFWSTHPSGGDRVNDILAIAPKVQPLYQDAVAAAKPKTEGTK
jgi:predicted Zn-dependent protease